MSFIFNSHIYTNKVIPRVIEKIYYNFFEIVNFENTFLSLEGNSMIT